MHQISLAFFNKQRVSQHILRVFLFAFGFLVAITNLLAQPGLSTDNKKAIKLYDEATNFLRRAQFPEAIEPLEKAIDKDVNFLEAYLRLADIYSKLAKPEISRSYYIKATAISPNSQKVRNAYYIIGASYLREGTYEEAEKYLQSYLEYPNLEFEEKIEASRLLSKVTFARGAMNNPVDFNPEPMSENLNQFQLQYFPAITVDGNTLIFTRRVGIMPYHDEDIYVTEKEADGEWGRPFSISPMINTDNNEGACTISADGRTIIYTICNASGGVGSCDLYISTKTGDRWSEPENLGQPVNSPSWESQPSLSPDGRTLYYVSNRGGGYGKRDIWKTVKDENDRWTMPVNMGDSINTPWDEISPFIHFNQQDLYFASDGHPGMGGYDLFLSHKNDTTWSRPKNLGYPLNNHDDQVSLFISAEGTTGYYANEVVASGRIVSSKIYSFPIPVSARVEHPSNFLTGTVRDAQTKEPLEAELQLYNLVTDQRVSKVTSDVVSGKYFVVLTEGQEYGIFINKKGYLFKNLSFDYKEKDNLEPEVLDILLEPIATGAQTELKNIFFETAKFTLQSKSKSELRSVAEFLKNNPGLKIEIAGHTDNTGSQDFNATLSVNRAKAVYDFLVQNGVDTNRMVYKGYGASEPVASNDTEEGKAQNRRIAFKILQIR